MKKISSKLMALAAAFSIICAVSCSDDSDSGESISDYSQTITESDGTTTLHIEENGSGFVSTTGSVKSSDTNWVGYSGEGYIESLTSGKTVVYTVSAESAITDAKIAVHYGMWNTETMVRGVLVTVNGTCINEGAAIKTVYTMKGTKGQVVDGRWIDSDYITGVSLNAGSNTIIIEGAPAESQTFNGETYTPTDDGALPNIDYLIVNGSGIEFGTDASTYYSFSVKTENSTAGSVTSSSSATSVVEGTVVTATATANDGWTFQCWSDGSTSNPYEKTVNDGSTLFAHFIPSTYTAPTASDGYLGYSTVTSDEAAAYTITGGAGGETITIDELADLTTYASELSSDTPYIVAFTSSSRITTSGNVSTIMSVGSNKTVYGATTGAGLKNIEMRVSGDNVIIRNLVLGEVIAYDTYGGTGNDALSLNGATHVWVDHCELRSNTTPLDNTTGETITNSSDEDFAKDFYDGLLDIKNGGAWITISNCYFHDHYKAVLCASGDDGPDSSTRTGLDDTDMRVTFYKNYFYNINARMPLFRYGTGHILNNYFEAGTFSDQASCINCRAAAKLYIEGNSFNNMSTGDTSTSTKIDLGTYVIGSYYGDASKAYGSVTGSWTAVNNNSNNGTKGSSSVSKPAYTYTASSYSSSAPSTSTEVGAILTTLSY